MEEPESGTDTNQDTTGSSRRWGDELGNPIEVMKQLALASLGAVAVATEATDEMFQALVKKGQEARDEAVREMRDARAKNSDKFAESETFLRARMEAMLNRANLASKGDVEALNAKLNIITRKLDEVQGRSSSTPGFAQTDISPPVTQEPPRDPGSV